MYLLYAKSLFTIILMIFIILIDKSYKSGNLNLTNQYLQAILSFLAILFVLEVLTFHQHNYLTQKHQLITNILKIFIFLIYLVSISVSAVTIKNNTSIQQMKTNIKVLQGLSSLIIIYNFGDMIHRYYTQSKIKGTHTSSNNDMVPGISVYNDNDLLFQYQEGTSRSAKYSDEDDIYV